MGSSSQKPSMSKLSIPRHGNLQKAVFILSFHVTHQTIVRKCASYSTLLFLSNILEAVQLLAFCFELAYNCIANTHRERRR